MPRLTPTKGYRPKVGDIVVDCDPHETARGYFYGQILQVAFVDNQYATGLVLAGPRGPHGRDIVRMNECKRLTPRQARTLSIAYALGGTVGA